MQVPLATGSSGVKFTARSLTTMLRPKTQQSAIRHDGARSSGPKKFTLCHYGALQFLALTRLKKPVLPIREATSIWLGDLCDEAHLLMKRKKQKRIAEPSKQRYPLKVIRLVSIAVQSLAWLLRRPELAIHTMSIFSIAHIPKQNAQKEFPKGMDIFLSSNMRR